MACERDQNLLSRHERVVSSTRKSRRHCTSTLRTKLGERRGWRVSTEWVARWQCGERMHTICFALMVRRTCQQKRRVQPRAPPPPPSCHMNHRGTGLGSQGHVKRFRLGGWESASEARDGRVVGSGSWPAGVKLDTLGSRESPSGGGRWPRPGLWAEGPGDDGKDRRRSPLARSGRSGLEAALLLHLVTGS